MNREQEFKLKLNGVIAGASSWTLVDCDWVGSNDPFVREVLCNEKLRKKIHLPQDVKEIFVVFSTHKPNPVNHWKLSPTRVSRLVGVAGNIGFFDTYTKVLDKAIGLGFKYVRLEYDASV